MSLTQSLANQESQAAEAKAKAAQAALDKASKQQIIAAAFDAGIEAAGITLPKLPMLHIHTLWGVVASLSFTRETIHFPAVGLGADTVLKLMAAFPPESAGIAKGGSFTSWVPRAYFDKQLASDRPEYREFSESPVVISMDWISGNTTSKVKWTTLLGGLLVEMCVQLNRQAGQPTLWVDTRHHNQVLVEIKRVDLMLTGDMAEFPCPLYRTYASGDRLSVGNRLMYSGDGRIVAMLQRMAELDAGYYAAALEAYEKDLVTGVPLADVIPCSPDLNAASKAQRAELNSDMARRERALAEKHWPIYAEKHGLKQGRYGFDYHEWAVYWLTQANLQPDPNYIRDGKPYSYGSAWVKESDE